ncbi:MAG: transporter, partial [Alloprevotella sp.]
MDIVRFVKDWTLPIAIGIGSVVYLFFALIPALDDAAVFFTPFFDQILPMFMFLILFVTFCKVDYRKLRPERWHFHVGAFQVILTALITAIVVGLNLQGDSLLLMEAIITCIVAPCAAAAPVVTQKIGGRLESITTFVFISNFITAILIPVCFPLIENASGLHFLDAFLLILSKVCSVLVLPLLLAYIVKHHMKRLHRLIVSVKDLSYYLWSCSLTILTGTTLKHIFHAESGIWVILAIAILGLIICIIQFAVGRFIGHYFNAVICAGQGLGQKNTAFAIWIAYTYLNPLSSV